MDLTPVTLRGRHVEAAGDAVGNDERLGSTYPISHQAANATIGVSRRMHAGNDSDLFTRHPIVKTVRKALEQETTRTAMDHGMGLWEGDDGCNRGVNSRDELIAQARTLLLVPVMCGVDVGRSRRPKPRSDHPDRSRSRCLTSSNSRVRPTKRLSVLGKLFGVASRV